MLRGAYFLFSKTALSGGRQYLICLAAVDGAGANAALTAEDPAGGEFPFRPSNSQRSRLQRAPSFFAQRVLGRGGMRLPPASICSAVIPRYRILCVSIPCGADDRAEGPRCSLRHEGAADQYWSVEDDDVKPGSGIGIPQGRR